MVVASRRYDRAGSLDFAWIIFSRVETEFPEPPATMPRCRTQRPTHVISHVRASSLYHLSRDGCAQGLDHRRGPANHGDGPPPRVVARLRVPVFLTYVCAVVHYRGLAGLDIQENGRAASMLRQDSRLSGLQYLFD